MELWQSLVLSLIQGITEFLPISSSGHLVITREIFNWNEAGAAFDAFTGLGTLTAVLIYFRREVLELLTAFFKQKNQGLNFDPNATLANQLLIASIPAFIFGFLIKDTVDNWGHKPLLIASTTLIFALFLQITDLWGVKKKQLSDFTLKTAIIVGLFQAIALIPGTSRSGITITAALLLGFNRQASAKFSFLLSIPISAAAGLYGLLKIGSDPTGIGFIALLLSFLISFGSAYLCIALFLKFLNKIGMWPHTIYRIFLATFLFLKFY